ncbi:MAG: DUF6427 family protein [Chitinophagia bacterium]
MVFLFRDKSVFNLFTLVLLSLVVHFHFFVSPPQIVWDNSNGLFSRIIGSYIRFWPETLLFIIYHFLILSQAIRLNWVLDNMKMFPYSNYVPAMTMILLSGLFTAGCAISPALLSGHLLIWVFVRLTRLFNHPAPKALLFNTGMVLGVAIMCYHPFFIVVFLVLFALAIVRSFKINEWMVLILGVLIPYYFAGSIAYLTDNFLYFFQWLPAIHPGLPITQLNLYTISSLSLLVIAIFLGIAYWQKFNGRLLMQLRKYWSVLLLMLVLTIILPFLMSKEGIFAGWLLIIPVSVFFSCFFSVPRRLVLPNLIFWLITASLVLHNLYFMKK